MQENYHTSVLLKESVDALNIKPDGVYVDITFGGGGHSREILKKLSPNGKLFAFDQDPDAVNNAIDDDRFTLIQQNFRLLSKFLRFYKAGEIDGLIGDFGVSSHQFDVAERGFSIRGEGILDMRMNNNCGKSAKDVINTYPQEDLSNILYKYGELQKSRGIASAIISKRENSEILTTTDLSQAVSKFLPRGKENKVLAQIYQAIRIEVNDELKVIEDMLLQLPEVIKQGGRIAFISYHSLEDRLVKRFIRDGKFVGQADKDFYGHSLSPFKKVGNFISPSKEEIQKNSRARSAKLRVGIKK